MNADNLIKFENETIGEIKGFINDITGRRSTLYKSCISVQN